MDIFFIEDIIKLINDINNIINVVNSNKDLIGGGSFSQAYQTVKLARKGRQAGIKVPLFKSAKAAITGNPKNILSVVKGAKIEPRINVAKKDTVHSKEYAHSAKRLQTPCANNFL